MGRLEGKPETITLKDFSADFFKNLKHGQVLGFTQEDGTTKRWRVSKVNHEKCTAKIVPWELFKPDEMDKLEEARDAIRND